MLTLLWRLPSVFDPPWVNDEGTYFAVAQAMARGFRLYVDVWENKPPGIYLVYGAVYHPFGPSLLAVRLLAAVAVLLLVVTVTRLAAHWVGRSAPLTAGLLAGLLMGVPFLEGTTANAEVFLALFAVAGVYFCVVRGSPVLGGIAVGIAILFKAVAGFDALAIGVWLLLHRRRMIGRYAAAVVAVISTTIIIAAVTGTLPAMLRDALLYDLGYVGWANGGALPWLVLLKLAALGAVTFAVRRRPFPYLWLAYTTVGALIGGRFFGHYALQAIAPLSVTLALLLPRLAGRRSTLVGLPVAFLAVAGLATVVGSAMSAAGHDTIFARRLQYYSNFAHYAIGAKSAAEYRSSIDDHVTRNLRIVSILRSEPAGRLLIWGNTPWVYPLSNRLPATAYTSALRQPEVPGEVASLRRAVIQGVPRIVVVVTPPVPSLGLAASVALRRLYRLVGSVDGSAIYARSGSRR